MKSRINIFLFTILDMCQSKNTQKLIVQNLCTLYSDTLMDSLKKLMETDI